MTKTVPFFFVEVENKQYRRTQVNISPLNCLFFFALLLFLSTFVSSVSSLMSPLPENNSSGASIAASETARGATYR